jgi:hypothetical protein
VDADRRESEIHPTLREEFEHLAEKLGCGLSGDHELLGRFQNGRLRWFEHRTIRVPASAIEHVVQPSP